MPADLTAIRALLASVEGFTPGEMRVSRGIGQAAVPSIRGGDRQNVLVAWGVANEADAALFSAASALHAHLTDLADEVEGLRAHNARMVALLNKVADAMDDAEHEAWDDGAEIVANALPAVGELRALAAGEVDDA